MKNTVTQEQVDQIFAKSKKEVSAIFNKCTVVSCQLPNGFIIVEHSACVDPQNYDYYMGAKICEERIKNNIWELEAYRLHCELHEQKLG